MSDVPTDQGARLQPDQLEHETAYQHELGDPMVDPDETAHQQHPSAKEYVRIGIILAVLTGMEVVTAYSQIKHSILIPTLLLLAFVKFVLVVLWFMHLKFDARTYARFFVMGLVGAFTLYLIVLMTLGAFSR
jgi:cytochrome c oxidase subunit 4